MKKQHIERIKIAKITMLRWMNGKTRKDRMRNEDIRDDLGIALIEEKIRANLLV